jgi:hypothetical protein
MASSSFFGEVLEGFKREQPVHALETPQFMTSVPTPAGDEILSALRLADGKACCKPQGRSFCHKQSQRVVWVEVIFDLGEPLH